MYLSRRQKVSKQEENGSCGNTLWYFGLSATFKSSKGENWLQICIQNLNSVNWAINDLRGYLVNI